MADISAGKERAPITLDCNEEGDVPLEFQYVTVCTAGPGVNLDTGIPFYPGCSCKTRGCSVEEQCSCLMKYGPSYLVENGQILLSNTQYSGVSPPVFECNTLCSCPPSCRNRLVQDGIKTKLRVFKTRSKGWGVRSVDNIIKGQFVCEYAGEIVSYEEAKRRTQEGEGCPNYIITVREHIYGDKVLRTHVDAHFFGNVGRFVNHSCDPNLTMILVRVDSLIPKLALFAARNICAGGELCFDYSGGAAGEEHLAGTNLKSKETTEIRGAKHCLCKAANCRGCLPCEPSLF